MRAVMSWCLTKTVDGDGFLLQDSEGEGNDLVAVALREVGDGADEAGAGAAELGASFADGVLADDGDSAGCAGFFEGAQGGEGADVVDRSRRGCGVPGRGGGTGG